MFTNIKHFTEDELQKVSSCPMHLNPLSLKRLDRAREIAGVPFVVNSAYRDPEQNAKVGGVAGSAHTNGMAFDIACNDSDMRWRIVFGLIAAGFPRIGIAKTFIHCDDDFTLPYPVMWLY